VDKHIPGSQEAYLLQASALFCIQGGLGGCHFHWIKLFYMSILLQNCS